MTEQWPSGYPERVEELLGDLAAAQERIAELEEDNKFWRDVATTKERATIQQLSERIKELEQQVAQQGEYVPVEDGELDKLGTVLRNRTIFIPCTLNRSILHGYTLQDDEYLVRRKEQPHE